MKKLLFLVITILLLETLAYTKDAEKNVLFVILYIGFILVSLYEIGKEEIPK